MGNLGTYSYASNARTAAEVMQMPWERTEIHRGRSDRHLPHSSGQGEANVFTMPELTGAGQDLIAKMKEIAAMDLGGASEDYEIGGERVYRSDDNSIGLTYAQTAQRAIELGGKFDGTEYPEDINPLTQLVVQGVQGSG